ncbi:MobA/MobL family protein, partial [Klebsiella pneumoniae]|uniref:MobA/MobL family protein n=1 Tax=Klebsiella pneumoniae TaxID=573 RepID=UPI003AF5E23B
MAIFYLETKPIKRSEGRSSVAASAYRAGVSLVDNRTGVKHSYEKKGKNGVVSKDCFMYQ